MASPRLEAGFATLNVDSSNDTRPHESDIEPTRSLEDPESQYPSSVCQWRTARFYDQECSRFFDCPSHLVERRFSEDNTGDETYMLPELSNRDNADPAIVGDNSYDMDNVQTSPVHPQDRELPPIPYSSSTGPNTGLWRTASESGPTRRGSQPGILRQTSRNTGEAPAGDQHRSDGQSRANRRSVVITEPTEAVNTLHRSRTHSSTDSGSGSATRFVGRRQSRDTAGDSQDSGDEERSTDFVLPRWQPDAEVTYCPICHNQFSIFVRKHHCRKCGRVVCASCSPHRIIIPHQYIVRAPGYELPASQNLLLDGLVASYGLSGGERVRLCNPCVPDPNIAPPHSPSGVRNSHSRSRNGTTRVHGGHGRYSMMHTPSEGLYSDRYYTPRTRSATMLPPAPGSGSGGTSRSSRHASDRYRSGSLVSAAPSSYPARIGSLSGAPSSSRRRAMPPRPQIAEEDECPVCHQELPSRTLPGFEALREDHITSCILEHSQYGNSPRRASASDRGESGGEASSLAAPRRTGMYTYPATEKDCVDDAECTICLEEFTVGVPMARLECLCRFHRSCIAAWFVNHPGRCPVHQHDGFGY